jgi:hypothetical protein
VRIRISLAAGLLLIVLAAILVLSHAPQTLARTNGVQLTTTLSHTAHDGMSCQRGEVLPRDTSEVQLGLFALLGPKITVQVFAGSRQIAKGTRAPGWDGTYVPVGLEALPHAVAPVTVCLRLSDVDSEVAFVGSRTPRALAMTSNGSALAGRITINYLRQGHASWWSLMSKSIQDLGFGHALAGIWNVILIAALTAGAVTLSSWLIVRELR